jgi:hypothetical protein
MPPRPIKWRKQGKYVTICAGFRCLNGIVVCADTDESTESFKRTVPKLEVRPRLTELSEHDSCRAVFTGSGDSSFVDALIDVMWKAIPQKKAAKFAEVTGKMEATLISHYRKIWSIYPKQTNPSLLPWADLMFAVWCADGCGLFLARGHDVSPVSGYVTVGCGGELAKYICDPLFDPALATEFIVLLAAFMLREVKEHVPSCGGESHVTILGNDGSISTPSPLDINFISTQIASYNLAVKHMPIAFANETLSDDEFSEVVNVVLKELIPMRLQYANNRRKFWDEVNKGLKRIQSKSLELGMELIKKRSVSRKSKDQQ